MTGTNLNINVQENKSITAGTGNDLVLTHDGVDSYVRHINSGQVSGSELRIQSAGNLIFEAFGGGNPNFIKCVNATNNHVEIYYDGAKKFETTNDGIKVTGKIESTGDIIAFAGSDRNLKDNITVIPNALDKVNALSGNTFTWKEQSGGYDDTGVIAQEVEALGLPNITTTRDDGTKAVRYDRLIPVLIQAVKELSAKVTALEGS